MKKIMIFLALMFAVAISNAQIATITIPRGNTYTEYTTDVTLTNTAAKYFQFNISTDYYAAPTYIVHLDSASGNHTNVACVLAGRVSDQTSTWTTIGTVNWAGTTADTTIIYSSSTEVPYRQYKLTFTGTGTGTTTIANTEFKFYYGTP